MADFMEFDLIDRLRRFQHRGRPGDGAETLIRGIGDDAAVLRTGGNFDWLYAADMSVEGVHFRTDYASFEDIGYKAMASNVSDIAAMGGEPACALVSLGLPSATRVPDVERLYKGMAEVTDRFGAVIAGGDVVESPVLTVSVSLLGKVETGRAVLRSGAQPGDLLCVTATLGDAAAGLSLLARAGAARSLPEAAYDALVSKQRRPTPRVEEARALIERYEISSMIDLSDGLAGDIRHMCRESGVGALIDAAAVPTSPALRQHARRTGADPLELALSGGEDYELLFTVRSEAAPALDELGFPVQPVGTILSASHGILLRQEDGQVTSLRATGFSHGSERPLGTQSDADVGDTGSDVGDAGGDAGCGSR